jgi:N-acyl-D-amino-acid deacylase
MPGTPRVLRNLCALALFGAAGLAASCQPMQTGETNAPFDVVIRNGHIIDGTGSPWYAGDVGVRDGRIAAIGDLSGDSAKQVIDAKGMVVAPGFIDKHYGITPDWRTFSQYFARLEKQGIGINMGTYVGAASAREMVLGYDDVQPTAAQLKQMQDIVAEAMREGALGVSTALQYPPAPYAKTDELIALAKVASQYGGIYATHMRSEGNAEMAALDEVFRIATEANVPVEIFHLKTAGTSNWGKMPQVVARIDSARQAGLDIASDTYAYTAWENGMSAFIPPWAHDGGTDSLVARLQDPATRARIRKDMLTPTSSWDNEWQEIPGPHAVLVTAVNNPELRPLQGMRLDAIAKQWNEDPIDALFDFLVKDHAGTYVAVFGMSEPDVELALKQPWVSIDNDASASSPEGILGEEHPHPRAYGTFPRILRKFVREQHLLTLPDAIRKFSALAAQRVHLTDRGVLKKGLWADVVVFDPATVTDRATFEDPAQFSVGMEYVLVNGVPVIAGGKMTGALPGQVIRGPAYER